MEYIFRFPAGTPELTFETLNAKVHEACGKFWRCSSCSLRIGTTVTVRWAAHADALIVRLYDLDIAWIYADRVAFTATDDPHMATTEWLAKIVKDNGIASGIWRVRRRKADGQGPATSRGYAGLLILGGEGRRPVHGHSYPVDHARVAERRAYLRAWEESIAPVRERLVGAR